MEPIRYNYLKCDTALLDEMLKNLNISGRYLLKSEKPANEVCHFRRYNYVYEGKKIVLVYDMKANILSVTALPDVLETVKVTLEKRTKEEYLPQKSITQKEIKQVQDIPPSTNTTLKSTNVAKTKPAKQSLSKPITQISQKPIEKPIEQKSQKIVVKSNEQTAQKPIEKPTTQVAQKPIEKPTTQVAQKTIAKTVEPTTVKHNPKLAIKPTIESIAKPTIEPAVVNAIVPADEVLTEYKNGFSVKQCTQEKLDGILKRIRALSGISFKIEIATEGKQEIKTYEICDGQKQRIKLRYIPKAGVLQLQGKRSNLFSEIQVILSRDSDYIAAVGSHIQLTGEEKRAGEIHKELKKLMPDALPYLSEQSKIDLSIGMIDIGNEEVKLSDYSVLLVPPYRGLERLIYDLQTAQGITVKMIGQAYEKDENGNYQLKIGYRKKIPGVIYNEVMSALYSEYFSKRNFYAHSDNSIDSLVRRIEDKAAAQQIFSTLSAIINYNCKKLKEIGFAVTEKPI